MQIVPKQIVPKEFKVPIDEPLGIDCPGCDTPLTLGNAGGYRTYCITCVSVIDKIPKKNSRNGFCEGWHLVGRYPNFQWVPAE